MFHCPKVFVHRTPFFMEHLTKCEVNSVELTLASVDLVNCHYGSVYELWRTMR